MMTDQQHPLVTDFLARLQTEAALRLPADRADELVADLRGHLRESIATDATESDVRNAVDRIGTPTDLVDDAVGSALAYGGSPAPNPGNRREMAALAMLVLSVIIAIAVPVAALLLIAGLILVLMSTRWRGSDKALASVVYTLLGMPTVVIVGLFAPMAAKSITCTGTNTGAQAPSSAQVCTSTGSGAPGLLLILAAVAYLAVHTYTAIRLYRRARVTVPA